MALINGVPYLNASCPQVLPIYIDIPQKDQIWGQILNQHCLFWLEDTQDDPSAVRKKEK